MKFWSIMFCYFSPMAFKLNFAVCHSNQLPLHYHYQQTFCAYPLGAKHRGTHLGQRAVISCPGDRRRVIIYSVYCGQVLTKGQEVLELNTLDFFMQLHSHSIVTATVTIYWDSVFFILDFRIMQRWGISQVLNRTSITEWKLMLS